MPIILLTGQFLTIMNDTASNNFGWEALVMIISLV